MVNYNTQKKGVCLLKPGCVARGGHFLSEPISFMAWAKVQRSPQCCYNQVIGDPTPAYLVSGHCQRFLAFSEDGETIRTRMSSAMPWAL